jgi:hypothetical protein
MCTWDQVPHLSEQAKKELWDSLPPHQRETRSRGVPALGSGVIYPVPEEDIVVAPFQIPDHWPRGYGLDVGWRFTAAIFGALDRDTDVLYLYDEYLRGEAEPAVHAAAIRARGTWLPGFIDPAAEGRNQVDGRRLMEMYRQLGLSVAPADNAVESGIYAVWLRMSTGRLKVFKSLGKYLEERRLYRRDEKGRIIKDKDHLQDATRYLVAAGANALKLKPSPRREPKVSSAYSGERGWIT